MIPWWVTTASVAPPVADMRLNVYHHFVAPDLVDVFARLDRMQRELNGLTKQGSMIMATTVELLAAVTAVTAEVARIGPAINALEAAVTAASQNASIPPADQANIDAALASLQTVATDLAAAVADAGDNTDESAVQP